MGISSTPRRLFVSFSGGETSAYMTVLILTVFRHLWDEVVVLFSNTGRENEATLRFVRLCDQVLGFKTIWVEAVVNHGVRKSCGHRVVDFDSASRNGEPFEEVIKKYGIPNVKFPHCTRELKLNPMLSYVASIGWNKGTYDTAIGIRADEPSRRDKNYVEKRIVYLLMDMVPTTKTQVNAHWAAQPFRLELTGYQGNCKNCFKKSMLKLLTIADEDPTVFDWTTEMGERYGHVGKETNHRIKGYRRVFFRNNLSSIDLINLHELSRDDLTAVVDDSLAVPVVDGCSTESCEVTF